MMNGMQAVTELAVYLKKSINGIQVFKFEKPTRFSEAYICLNYLAINYGTWVNTTGIVNVNIHVPDLSDGQPDIKRLQNICKSILELIPAKNNETEDDEKELIINRHQYNLESDSNCMKDNDNTHFVNFRVQVTFTN